MKKVLSLLLSVAMILTMTGLAFAEDNDGGYVTQIRATKVDATPSYTIHIPADTTLEYGSTSMQQLGVTGDGVYISESENLGTKYIRCTPTGTQLTKEGGDETIETGYFYKTTSMSAAKPLNSFICLNGQTNAANIYAQVDSAEKWEKATPGTYKASVSFAFEVVDKITIKDLMLQNYGGAITKIGTFNGQYSFFTYDVSTNKLGVTINSPYSNYTFSYDGTAALTSSSYNGSNTFVAETKAAGHTMALTFMRTLNSLSISSVIVLLTMDSKQISWDGTFQ